MGFFKTMLRINTTIIGTITGSDFPNCYLSKTKKDGRPALLIYGTKSEDFIFDKSDVKNFSILESNTRFAINGQGKIGNKYRVVFKNGKSAILNVPANECSVIESVLY